jgi:two-component system, response regulator PhcR
VRQAGIVTEPLTEARTILFVDDEPGPGKWFARIFADEFDVLTASGASEALALLAERSGEIAVLVTDYRMPETDGMQLLQTVQRDYRHVMRVLATAYAEKDVAIAAVNQGKVLRILEKPLDEAQTREALREALALHRARALERALNESRVAALRETLGFLAHELNTPLATVRGYIGSVRGRHVPRGPDSPEGVAQFSEHDPGEVLAALEAAERRALYCQSLVSTFVQSARDAYPGAELQPTSAAAVVRSLLEEFPFESNERAWVTSDIREDFALPGRRDLLYLVLCTLTKNALMALRGRDAPGLVIEVGRETDAGRRPLIRFTDNGPGIPAGILARLTREPVTTRGEAGGSGMGLMFCRRVMQSVGGEIAVASPAHRGAEITLFFKPTAQLDGELGQGLRANS